MMPLAAPYIAGKKFRARIFPSNKDGEVAAITETGFVIMDADSIGKTVVGSLREGEGDAQRFFSLDAGILGTFASARKRQLRMEPVASNVDIGGTKYLAAKYTLEWSISGTDWSTFLT